MALLFAETQVHNGDPNAAFVVLSPALTLKSTYTFYLLLIFRGSLSLEAHTFISFNSKLLTPANS